MSGETPHNWSPDRIVTLTGPDGVRHSFPAEQAPAGYSEACGTTRRLLVVVDSLAPWEHAAGSYGPDAVPYEMRRASWRLLILAGAL